MAKMYCTGQWLQTIIMKTNVENKFIMFHCLIGHLGTQ